MWDYPVRVFHVLLIICIAGAWLSGEEDEWKMLHLAFGYTAAALVVFRILWGFIGSRRARFSSFVQSPFVAWEYLRSHFNGKLMRFAGHNPAGGLAVLAILGTILLAVASGWLVFQADDSDTLEELHEVMVNALLVLVGVHIVAVLVTSYLHRENLPRAMITGYKLGLPGEGIENAYGWLGILLVIAAVVFGWMVYSGLIPILTAT
jgi:cytochrome b